MFFKREVTGFDKDIEKACIILEAATGNLTESVTLTPNGESAYYECYGPTAEPAIQRNIL